MRYALLVCSDESAMEDMTTEGVEQLAVAFDAFEHEMRARGVLVGRERLRPTATATTVRVRSDDLIVADGPFAETKEQIAGFYLIECEDLDAAIEVASKVPAAQSGAIEVRPVWER